MSAAACEPAPARVLPPLFCGGAAAAALVAAWWAQDGDGRQALLAAVLYWLMPLALALWLAAIARARAADGAPIGAWLRARAATAALAALFVGAVVLAMPAAMRMQFDETSLLGTAFGMHGERAAWMPLGALPTPAGVVVTDWNLDKRPPLWPFLVSVAHDVAGVRVGNAFAANAFDERWLRDAGAGVARRGHRRRRRLRARAVGGAGQRAAGDRAARRAGALRIAAGAARAARRRRRRRGRAPLAARPLRRVVARRGAVAAGAARVARRPRP